VRRRLDAGYAIAGGVGRNTVISVAAFHAMLHWKPRRADWRPEARAPKPIFFVERPASWLLQRAEARRFRQGRAFGARSSERMRRPLTGFFRLCQARCLKRGHSDEKESWSTSLLPQVRVHVGEGRCGEGTAPHGWERKTPALSAIAAKEGRRILPTTKSPENYLLVGI
jgi:hypothetical protein